MGLLASCDSRIKTVFQMMMTAIKVVDQAIVERQAGFSFCTWTETESAGGHGCIQEPKPISGNRYNERMTGEDIIRSAGSAIRHLSHLALGRNRPRGTPIENYEVDKAGRAYLRLSQAGAYASSSVPYVYGCGRNVWSED